MANWTKKLRDFYDDAGIGVASFSCPHQHECEGAASPRPLHFGAEAYVGPRYGKALRIVVVSLDTGHASSDLDERRAAIESLGPEKLNPHMKGTTILLSRLLDAETPVGANPHPYYAMINAAKCSGADGSKNKLPSRLYRNCRYFALRELALLKPQLIVTQGNDAAAAVGGPDPVDKGALLSVVRRLGARGAAADYLVSLGQEYLRRCTLLEAAPVYVLQAPHPAARDGRWQIFERILLDPVVAMARQLVGATA